MPIAFDWTNFRKEDYQNFVSILQRTEQDASYGDSFLGHSLGGKFVYANDAAFQIFALPADSHYREAVPYAVALFPCALNDPERTHVAGIYAYREGYAVPSPMDEALSKQIRQGMPYEAFQQRFEANTKNMLRTYIPEPQETEAPKLFDALKQSTHFWMHYHEAERAEGQKQPYSTAEPTDIEKELIQTVQHLQQDGYSLKQIGQALQAASQTLLQPKAYER